MSLILDDIKKNCILLLLAFLVMRSRGYHRRRQIKELAVLVELAPVVATACIHLQFFKTFLNSHSPEFSSYAKRSSPLARQHRQAAAFSVVNLRF